MTDLQRIVTRQENALTLLRKLDRVRDMLSDEDDPRGMFQAMALTLRETFQAEACAILVVAETSDEIELIVSSGLPETQAQALCQTGLALTGIQKCEASPLPHAVTVQIVLDEYPMGCVFLGRHSKPFDEDDLWLLAHAEDQLDSAVIQARMIWALAQRNRELEAIYEIDRLRDRIANESDLIAGFTNIVMTRLQAQFSLLLLALPDSDELVIRSLIDRQNLPSATLDQIRERVRRLTIPQVIESPDGSGGLILLAAPFAVDGVRLGAIVIGRSTPYSIADHRLMHAMMTQMDSAMVYVRTMWQLAQRQRELEVIYRVDRIRDQEKDFDGMLQAVLSELSKVVSSEISYIMLYDQGQEHELELRLNAAHDIGENTETLGIMQRISSQALSEGKMIVQNTPEGAVRSIVAIPLILNERIIGVFGVVNATHPRGFDRNDEHILSAITSQIDTAIFERLEQRRMRALLSRSVDPKVLEMMLQRASSSVLTGERVVISVLFADLRGSTEWAERTQPEELVYTLNSFLTRMTDVIFKYGGTLDKFVGDEVIGLFGTPLPMTDHAERAASAALEMQAIHIELQAEMARQGRELPYMGIGVSSGEAIAGEFGHPVRSEFTAQGRVMNLGSRLCSAAKGGQVIISHITREMAGDHVQVNPLEPLPLKGITNPAPIYELISVSLQS
jgi:adenylate cyclase